MRISTTTGVDIDSQDVTVTDCDFESEDDALCLKSDVVGHPRLPDFQNYRRHAGGQHLIQNVALSNILAPAPGCGTAFDAAEKVSAHPLIRGDEEELELNRARKGGEWLD